jgi:hypothetical protein
VKSRNRVLSYILFNIGVAIVIFVGVFYGREWYHILKLNPMELPEKILASKSKKWGHILKYK